MPWSSVIVTEVCTAAVYDHVVIDSIVYLCYKKCVTPKLSMVSHSHSTCSCNFLRVKKSLLVSIALLQVVMKVSSREVILFNESKTRSCSVRFLL
jgi:hypothetical protein